MGKRILSLALASVMAIGTASGAFAETENITYVKMNTHYIEGTGDGMFSANEDITREAIATMIARANSLEGGQLNFIDEDSISSWASEAIAGLQSAGIVKGDDESNFRPKENITRAELAAIIIRTYEKTSGKSIEAGNISFDDVDEGVWYAAEVKKASAAGLIKGTGDGKFNPSGNATRAETVVMINRMLGFGEDVLDGSVTEYLDTDFKDDSEWPDWAKNAIILASSDFGVHYGDIALEVTGTSDRVYGPERGTLIIEGELTLAGDVSGEITLRNMVISGDSVVNTPNATVTVEDSVVGKKTTYIYDVSGNTFNNRGKLNKVVIMDHNGGSFNNTGSISGGITISPSAESTAPVVLRGTIDAPVTVSGDNKPKVSLGADANIKGKITVDAENTEMNIDKEAKVEQFMAINKPITLISSVPVKAEVAKDVEVTVKTSSDAKGQDITYDDIFEGEIKVPEETESGSDDSDDSVIGGNTSGGSSGGSSSGGSSSRPQVSTAPSVDNITVTNNNGSADTVSVTGLSAGDVVKVYDVATGGTAIGTVTVAQGETNTTVTIDELGDAAGKVYVTVTSTDMTESARTEKAYDAEQPLASTTPVADNITVTNNNGSADTVSVTELSAGDVVKVYDAATEGTVIGTATVAQEGTNATVTIDELGDAAGKVYVTVTSTDMTESARIEKAYEAEVSTAPSADNITVTNNNGSADTVSVTGLSAGDLVKVYDVATGGTAIGTATVAQGETNTTVTIDELGDAAGSVYVTVTSPDMTESARTEKAYDAEVSTAPSAGYITVTNNNGSADTVSVTELSAGDVVKVYDAATEGTVIGTATVAQEGTNATVTIDELGDAAGKVYVTVTSTDMTESARAEKTYDAEVSTASVEVTLSVSKAAGTTGQVPTTTVRYSTESAEAAKTGTEHTNFFTGVEVGPVDIKVGTTIYVYAVTVDEGIGSSGKTFEASTSYTASGEDVAAGKMVSIGSDAYTEKQASGGDSGSNNCDLCGSDSHETEEHDLMGYF